jgi:hypothetical protein
MMKAYTVFNVDQCDGLPDRVMTLGEIKARKPDMRDAVADEFLAASGASIREGYGEASASQGPWFICAALTGTQRPRAAGHRSALGVSCCGAPSPLCCPNGGRRVT